MQHAVESIGSAAKFYAADLEALSEEQILRSVGGSARCVVDFSYEVGYLNHRFAATLRGEDLPPEAEDEGWTVAPASLRSKRALIDYLNDSFEELLAAAKSIPDEEADKMVGTKRMRPAHALASFAAMHAMYHDAQINFIQCINGDMSMHWD